MHKAAWDFIESVKAKNPKAFKGKRVLEVGSRYINGTVRTLFEGCQYTGIDLSPGPCVDVVAHVKDFEGENLYDTIISCEALEHDFYWEASVHAMHRLLKPGGLLIITAGGTGRPEHGTTRTNPSDSPATTDYYGNIEDWMFIELLEGSRNHLFEGPYGHEEDMPIDKDGDFRFWGVKA